MNKKTFWVAFSINLFLGNLFGVTCAIMYDFDFMPNLANFFLIKALLCGLLFVFSFIFYSEAVE